MPEPGQTHVRAILFVIACVLVVAATQFQLILNGQATGYPVDSDGWARLLRVRELWRTGQWFPDLMPYLSAPDGLSLHWTRLLDLPIIAGAWIGVHWLGMSPDAAILLAGAVVCPVLYVLVAASVGWAAKAAWPGQPLAPWFALVALIGNGPLKAYSMLGRSDHHVLVVLGVTLGLGFALRAVSDPSRLGVAFASGLAFGFGIWVVPEAMMIAIPVCAGLGASWALTRSNADAARCGVWICLGMATITAIAIAVERPPAEWAVTEYDRISAHHLVLCLMMAGVFAAALGLSGTRIITRATTGTVLAATASGVLLWLYPGTLGNAMAAAQSLPNIQEMAPIRLRGPSDWQDVLIFLGLAPAALIGLAALSWRGPSSRSFQLALLLAGPLLVTIVATLLHRRFGAMLAPVGAICAAGLIGVASSQVQRQAVRVPLMFGGLLLLAPGFLAAFLPVTANAGLTATLATPCTAMDVATRLQRMQPAPASVQVAPIILSSDPDTAAELAWRTGFRFVAAPYHRGLDAIADTAAFFRSTDEQQAEALLRRRNVTFVLYCPGSFVSDGALARSLASGSAPTWLEPVPSFGGEDGGATLWRVRRDP